MGGKREDSTGGVEEEEGMGSKGESQERGYRGEWSVGVGRGSEDIPQQAVGRARESGTGGEWSERLREGRERIYLNKLWEERERLAQEEWRRRKEWEAKEKVRREETEVSETEGGGGWLEDITQQAVGGKGEGNHKQRGKVQTHNRGCTYLICWRKVIDFRKNCYITIVNHLLFSRYLQV